MAASTVQLMVFSSSVRPSRFADNAEFGAIFVPIEGGAPTPTPGAKTRPTPASQYPSEQIVEISKVWAFRSTLELGRSHIKAELGEFVQTDKQKKTQRKEDEAAGDCFGRGD